MTFGRGQWPAVLIGTILGSIVGCDATPTGEIVETVPAGGILTYLGDPLPFHKVTVMPAGGRPAVGVTDELGMFVLGTNDLADGAESGTHPVAVSYVGPPSDDPEEGLTKFTPPPPPEVKIDRKYENPETSGLSVSISESGELALAINLE